MKKKNRESLSIRIKNMGISVSTKSYRIRIFPEATNNNTLCSTLQRWMDISDFFWGGGGGELQMCKVRHKEVK